jgi:hypothetical protein
MIEARQAHDTQREKCEALNEVLRASKEDCDEEKKTLEHASCAVHHEHVLGSDDLDTAWNLATENLKASKEAVQTLQQHRVAELRGLKQIECIVEELYTRGGKPCDEDGNEADEIAADCAAAGSDTSSLDIAYPETPEKPEADAADPHPCDSNFLSQEYGQLTSSCFNDMVACTACPAVTPSLPSSQTAAALDTYSAPTAAITAEDAHLAIASAIPTKLKESFTCGDAKEVEEAENSELMSSGATAQLCAEKALEKGFNAFILGKAFKKNCFGQTLPDADGVYCASTWIPTTLFDSYSAMPR